jgi:hypothetical protein
VNSRFRKPPTIASRPVLKEARWHTYQILTKRSTRMRDLLQSRLRFAADSLETLDLSFFLYQELETAGFIWFRPESAGTNGRLKRSEIAFRLICVSR